jgi:hypothetical protein
VWIQVGPDVLSWVQEKKESNPDKIGERSLLRSIACPEEYLKEDGF